MKSVFPRIPCNPKSSLPEPAPARRPPEGRQVYLGPRAAAGRMTEPRTEGKGPVNLAQKFGRFSEHWTPKIVGEVNDFYLKLVKFQGEFLWHRHAAEDELFLVHRGAFTVRLRDRDVPLKAGEFFVVPRGVEHMPVAREEAQVILLERKSTVNTGSAGGERTVRPTWI